MEELHMTEYRIRVLRAESIPCIRALHLFGIHRTSNWRSKQDLNTCKINYFVSGHSYIIVNDNSYIAEPGDVFIYRPHDVHFGNIPYEQNIEYYELQFEPEALTALEGGEELIRLFSAHSSEKTHTVQIHPNSGSNKKLSNSFRRLFACLADNSNHKNIIALTLMIGILCEIDSCRDFTIEPKNVDYYSKALMSAIQFINCNYQRNITTTDICNAAFISRSYLNRVFRKYLFCTPHDYLLSLRLSQACIMLSDGISVTDAAIASGFQDSAYFAAIFKRKYKLTPSEFRSRYYRN